MRLKYILKEGFSAGISDTMKSHMNNYISVELTSRYCISGLTQERDADASARQELRYRRNSRINSE